MVKHVLANGRVLQDIKGHKITKKDAPVVYNILEQSKKEKEKRNGKL